MTPAANAAMANWPTSPFVVGKSYSFADVQSHEARLVKARRRFARDVAAFARREGRPVTLDEGRDVALVASSLDRAARLIDLAREMTRSDWLSLVGEQWTVCDTIGPSRLAFRRLLGTGLVPEMMDTDEARAHAALPDVVEVFRGCGRHNLRGASWSLSERVARQFPFTSRYQQEEPLLVRGRVRKDRILAIKLNRDEAECISFSVRRTSVEPLS